MASAAATLSVGWVSANQSRFPRMAGRVASRRMNPHAVNGEKRREILVRQQMCRSHCAVPAEPQPNCGYERL